MVREPSGDLREDRTSSPQTVIGFPRIPRVALPPIVAIALIAFASAGLRALHGTVAIGSSFADTTATKRSLLVADSSIAASAASTEAFLDAVDPVAPLLLPGHVILRGAGSARGPLLDRYGGTTTYTWRPAFAVASADDRFGCTAGVSRREARGDGASVPQPGVYVTCWRRDAGGRWRVMAHLRNEREPGASPASTSDSLPAAPRSATTMSPSDAALDAERSDASFATLAKEPAGPGPAFARFAAVDAVLITPREWFHGSARIAALFAGLPHDRVLLWEPAHAAGSGSGGLAVTVGQSTTRLRDREGGPESRGTYLTVWRQESDGRWLYVVDLGAPRP